MRGAAHQRREGVPLCAVELRRVVVERDGQVQVRFAEAGIAEEGVFEVGNSLLPLVLLIVDPAHVNMNASQLRPEKTFFSVCD